MNAAVVHVKDSTIPAGSETCLVLGGSAGLGRELAERFAAAGYALVLLSSDSRDSLALAADLRLRYGSRVEAVPIDLASGTLDFARLDAALGRMPPLAGILVPAGMNAASDVPDQPFGAFSALTLANYTNVCGIIGHCLPPLRQARRGFVVGFGSIAAARGRTRNTAYSAAKRALRSYFESLRHASSDWGVVAQFYELGYLDTNLAFGQKTPFAPASPHQLAERVLAHRFVDFGVRYYPGYWRCVSVGVRLMPWFVFRRLSF